MGGLFFFVLLPQTQNTHTYIYICVGKAKNDIDIPENEMIPDSQGRLTDKVEKIQVSTLVHQYLEAQNLGVLAENGMQKAVSTFVEKDDKDAIKM